MNNGGMVREDSDVALEASHFAFLQQNKNLLANNVLWKRKEQLVQWESSETNRLPSVRKPIREPKVKFTDADIFLSACLSGDLEEVQTLLEGGADINTTTVDGLTALHQAVIDGKPKMVQFLVEHGANLNAQDNEGWTPLHAAACCGNVDLVEYLCAEGADLSVTNSDKELAVDLAEEDDCRLALEEEHQRRGIDPDECRNRELTIMRRDAEQWLKDGEIKDRPHARTGATALHVAAAKGYSDVLRLLLRAGADVHCRDRDGWTPLHAAAHWGEHETAAILIQHGASFTELTNNDETVLNVADKGIVEYLEGMQEKEQLRLASSNSVNVLMHANTQLKRAGSTTSVLRMSTEEKTKKTKLDEQDENKELREGHYAFVIEDKSPSPSVEVRLPFPAKQQQQQQQQRDTSESLSEEERSSSKSSSEGSSEEKSVSTGESKNSSDTDKGGSSASESVAQSESEQKRSPTVEDTVTRMNSASPSSPAPVVSTKINELKSSLEMRNSSSTSSIPNSSSISRSGSTDSNSLPTLPSNQSWHKAHSVEKELTTTATTTTTTTATTTATSVSVEPSTRFSKPVSLATPPMEPNLPNESEAERRSKAKRQRDSRRSTQGVTREQLRAATTMTIRRDDREKEKENETQWNGRGSSSSPSQETSPSDEIEKRVGEGRKDSDAKTYSSNQSLSAVRRRSQVPRTIRRVTGPIQIDDLQAFEESSDDFTPKNGTETLSSVTTVVPTSSAVDLSSTASATTSYGFRDNAHTTVGHSQATITSKGRPISQTNAVHIGGGTTTSTPFQMLNNRTNCQETVIDYKALYEKEKQETDRLRRRIEELSLEKSNSANNIALLKRGASGRLTSPPLLSKSPSSASMDDRERRNYEQRIAEMQYEIEKLEHLRADNQKLREENGALIRVISKLSK